MCDPGPSLTRFSTLQTPRPFAQDFGAWMDRVTTALDTRSHELAKLLLAVYGWSSPKIGNVVAAFEDWSIVPLQLVKLVNRNTEADISKISRTLVPRSAGAFTFDDKHALYPSATWLRSVGDTFCIVAVLCFLTFVIQRTLQLLRVPLPSPPSLLVKLWSSTLTTVSRVLGLIGYIPYTLIVPFFLLYDICYGNLPTGDESTWFRYLSVLLLVPLWLCAGIAVMVIFALGVIARAAARGVQKAWVSYAPDWAHEIHFNLTQCPTCAERDQRSQRRRKQKQKQNGYPPMRTPIFINRDVDEERPVLPDPAARTEQLTLSGVVTMAETSPAMNLEMEAETKRRAEIEERKRRDDELRARRQLEARFRREQERQRDELRRLVLQMQASAEQQKRIMEQMPKKLAEAASYIRKLEWELAKARESNRQSEVRSSTPVREIPKETPKERRSVKRQSEPLARKMIANGYH